MLRKCSTVHVILIIIFLTLVCIGCETLSPHQNSKNEISSLDVSEEQTEDPEKKVTENQTKAKTAISKIPETKTLPPIEDSTPHTPEKDESLQDQIDASIINVVSSDVILTLEETTVTSESEQGNHEIQEIMVETLERSDPEKYQTLSSSEDPTETSKVHIARELDETSEENELLPVKVSEVQDIFAEDEQEIVKPALVAASLNIKDDIVDSGNSQKAVFPMIFLLLGVFTTGIIYIDNRYVARKAVTQLGHGTNSLLLEDHTGNISDEPSINSGDVSIKTINPFDLALESDLPLCYIEFFSDLFLIHEHDRGNNTRFNYNIIQHFIDAFFSLSPRDTLQIKIRIFSGKYTEQSVESLDISGLNHKTVSSLCFLYLLLLGSDGRISHEDMLFIKSLFQHIHLESYLLDTFMENHQIVVESNKQHIDNKLIDIEAGLLHHEKSTGLACKEDIMDMLFAISGIEKNGVIEAATAEIEKETV